MFNFLKKHKPLESDEELKLSVKERALKAFSKIEGLDDMLWNLERTHTLLIGPPASAKSLFMLEIEKLMPPNKVYFIEGGSTTKAGIQKFIAENPQKEIIIIDEIDKMLLKDQEGLLTMMERGEFTRITPPFCNGNGFLSLNFVEHITYSNNTAIHSIYYTTSG
jgi:hypothetical protein